MSHTLETQALQPPPRLALYIHWPFCAAKCPYCDFNSHVRDTVDQPRFRQALLAEMAHMHAAAPHHRLSSIFFGGGTPSLMPPATAGALIEEAIKRWGAEENLEITLEANPTSVEREKLREFKGAGINRVSIGVQSLRGEALRFLGRAHSADEAKRAIDVARHLFDRYSFDLIYARPNQTLNDWERELGEALSIAGGHLSLYQLTIEENTAFHHMHARGDWQLPPDDVAAAMYELTEAMVGSEGMRAYEISNYARPGQESRHNLSYWQGDDYAGIGPGAHGRLRTHTGAPRIATATLKSPERWLSQVETLRHGLETWQELEPAIEMEERLMMGLRLTSGIDDAAFLPYVHAEKRALFVREGLLSDLPGRLQATLGGRLVLTRLTADLIR